MGTVRWPEAMPVNSQKAWPTAAFSPTGMSIAIQVDTGKRQPLRRIWRYEGYDEVNYTYTHHGRELLAKLGGLSDAPYFIRAHFLLCSGDGTGRPKWGSSNVYTEDPAGNPVYAWDIIDRVFDTYYQVGCVPFVELGFMPEALTTAPAGVTYGDPKEGGWKYPPRDYAKWQELIRQLALHSLKRYGLRYVSQWYWELWNEPDISFYWQGTVQEYCRLYDHTVAGLTEVLPQAKVGGPGTTNPGREHAGEFLRAFLDHCVHGQNMVTGKTGSRLDFISFHSKGGGFKRDPNEAKHTPSIAHLIDNIQIGVDIAADFPELAGRELILTECDPDGYAARSIHENPNMIYRNTEYYASYVATAVCRLLDLAPTKGSPAKGADAREIPEIPETQDRSFQVDGMLTWAFEFENRGCFEGLRTLSTNGIDKPVLNVFRFLSKLGRIRLHVEVPEREHGEAQREKAERSGAMAKPEVSLVAAADEHRGIQLFLASHHDDWDVRTETSVEVRLRGLAPDAAFRMKRFQVDSRHSNAHTVWREMGEPQQPTTDQLERLEKAGRPELVEEGAAAADGSGTLRLTVQLPAHSVWFVSLSPT